MIIGLSGGCGSGKSTVADIIAQQGFSTKTIKADHMIHDILKNERVKEVLTRWWGTWILSEGEIDHARIATIVFNHKDQLLRLERYMHPMVKLRIKKDLKDIDGFDFVLLMPHCCSNQDWIRFAMQPYLSTHLTRNANKGFMRLVVGLKATL
jgi:dephospho-CoA kinase